MLYIGRFAPSPSGELHFGSLIAALGSYLQARARQGQWLVRIEDIDPPREVPGAAETILRQLEHYGLHWDGDILWQSQRHDAYRERLAWLAEQGLSYNCTCTRARIQSVGGVYDGHCRTRHNGPENAAMRLIQRSPVTQFTDVLSGTIQADERLAREDFIIHRRDGLFAYNLAVVVDDHFQGVTEIVRGADSKQNHAPALPDGDPRPVLIDALRFLNQNVTQEWQDLSLDELLKTAIADWALMAVPKIQHSQMRCAEL
ncbi:MAG: tRNA glutamyl-Q(34) synthetase GluQRS [Enterobacter hormaechei]|nr:tRNA glutamyl-Q(34) synthetase GluQRS [Enterobacter hormaechei]